MNSQKIRLAQSSFLGGVQDPPRGRASRGEIFVMDEDVAMRETLSIALQEEGYDVVCFADSTALLAVARERTPACMFIEVRNPERAANTMPQYSVWPSYTHSRLSCIGTL